MAQMSEVDQARIRKAVRAKLLERVSQSVTSGSGSGRTVDDPQRAAEYVVNMLTVHDLELLADAAVVFASRQIEALILTGHRLRHDVADQPTEGSDE